MIKALFITFFVFMIYTFVSVNTAAKAEIVRTTIDIPVKITQGIAHVMSSIDEARVASQSNNGG